MLNLKLKKSTKSEPKKGGAIAFLRSVKVELDLVKWPNRQETARLTAIVIGVSLFIGLYIGGLDVFFTTLLTKLLSL
jgi:preprotein translocase SecE subunit